MLITFEGIDGCGKSTQVRLLEQELQKRGKSVIRIADPLDSGFGWAVQRLAGRSDITPHASAMFFLAAKYQIYEKLIRGQRKNAVILCDRWLASTIAYQGYGHGLGSEIEHTVHAAIPADFWPDMTFILDIDPELSFQRIDDADRRWFQRVGSAYVQRVRNGFLTYAHNEPYISVYHVTEKTDPAQVHQMVLETVLSVLEHG
jgi:dTMP kinase